MGTMKEVEVLLLVSISCAKPDAADRALEPDPVADESAIVNGEPVTILAHDGSTLIGLAVSVRRLDGSIVPAIFRGPAKLADVASGGTFEFREDSLHSRVRLLETGEEMRRRSVQRP